MTIKPVLHHGKWHIVIDGCVHKRPFYTYSQCLLSDEYIKLAELVEGINK